MLHLLRCLLASSLVLVLAAGAAAQAPAPNAEDTATARALFEEGLQLVDAKRWEEAADRFARVLDIRWSSVAAYNLATSLIELGALVEASEALRAVIRDDSAGDSMRQSAREQLAGIEKRIGKLRLEVSGDGVGVVITIDDRELPPAAWNVAVPVDPGPHRVTAYRGDRIIFEDQAVVDGGGKREVVMAVPLPASAPTPAAAAATVAVDVEPLPAHDGEPARADADDGDRWWLWIGAGILAAGALAAVAVVVASEATSEAPPPVAGDFQPGVLHGNVGAW